REPRDQRCRTSRAGGRAHRPLRERRRKGAGDRLDGLWARRPRPSADRLGQARVAGPGGRAGDASALALTTARWAFEEAHGAEEDGDPEKGGRCEPRASGRQWSEVEKEREAQDESGEEERRPKPLPRE